MVADELGISSGLLSQWKARSDQFIAQAANLGSVRKVHDGTPRQYQLEEEVLYMSFINKRQNIGFPIDHFWLRSEMNTILTHTRGPNHGAKLSKGWLNSFTALYNISSQLKTEKKKKSALERKPLIDQFHTDLMLIQRIMPQVDPVWGAYPPTNIWNADHVPLPFIVNFKRSLNPVGSDCWIAQFGASGLDKRQATIHLWYLIIVITFNILSYLYSIRADGEQLMPPWIIFRGEGHITQEEVDFLDALDIGWAFHPNAWADSPYSRRYLRAFIATLRQNGLGDEKHLLLLDDLAAQKTTTFNEIALAGNVLPFPIPGGTSY